MIIEIKNFGPIKNIKFDLSKDLNLIYGDNAIGKSYATYCLYCLIKNIKNKSIYQYYTYQDKVDNKFSKFVKRKYKNLKQNNSVNISKDLVGFIESDLKEIILSGLQNSLLNTFSSLTNLKNRYTNLNYEILIHVSTNECILIYSDDDGNLDLSYENDIKELKFLLKDTISTKYTLIGDRKKIFGEPDEDSFSQSFRQLLINKVNDILTKVDFNIKDIYYLPASRSGLYQALNAFTPIIAELTQNRFFIQNKSIELPSLSEPLSDYFIDLSTIDKENINEDYSDIITQLQNDLLKGEVKYDDKTKRILYKPQNIDLELNLSESSSMVAELSPLVIYFKHILNHKYSSIKKNNIFFYDPFYSRKRRREKGYDILFIEEPEAHLHPEIQVKLIELFVKLTKYKLKIFITSHSNYMFNKINNILIKNELDPKKMSVHHLIKDTDYSTIEGNMEVDEEGINDNNFQDISEKLYMERLNYFAEGDD
ncbi:AAA15 family ATPase/GTPase [Chryseobacterium sp. SORGH_AS 447]|uniref:AAA family ATPase n=1 Tax=Chryseobacterium sp. SORGH_AS_0447 TaxID=3041769 RepID=UPI00278126A0|nr:AAA family ATPase [Chryseobacterium sp. SORGH_AS_0447]MDQ1161904.1 AAA15 family ATPase/GTPase [Chryseobacterium sp. SORGH_AS_0447]